MQFAKLLKHLSSNRDNLIQGTEKNMKIAQKQNEARVKEHIQTKWSP